LRVFMAADWADFRDGITAIERVKRIDEHAIP
jgi:hypothetical protein